MSTGPITERAVAEMGNPQADVIWMVNNFALGRLKEAGALEPCRPAGMAVPPEFVDPDGFWIGHNATIMAMAVNTKLLAERGLPMPQDWADLIKPVYDDRIVVAAATKSGAGFTIVSTMLDMFGWNYLDNLDANIFEYGESGSAPARQIGAGEAATHQKSPLLAAAGLAALDVIAAERLVARGEAMGRRLADALAAGCPGSRGIHRCGLLVSVELDERVDPARVVAHACRRGLNVTAGPGRFLDLRPPLVVSEAESAAAVHALAGALAA